MNAAKIVEVERKEIEALDAMASLLDTVRSTPGLMDKWLAYRRASLEALDARRQLREAEWRGEVIEGGDHAP